jgi:hypothetical protein
MVVRGCIEYVMSNGMDGGLRMMKVGFCKGKLMVVCEFVKGCIILVPGCRPRDGSDGIWLEVGRDGRMGEGGWWSEDDSDGIWLEVGRDGRMGEGGWWSEDDSDGIWLEVGKDGRMDEGGWSSENDIDGISLEAGRWRRNSKWL